ncbi:alkaline phosphatase [Pseudemcibacter aquimaris]|uniref:alkaline phosphatase n=1 Tax=Pseudemcibacter aquimaris TaxID=2857064 RepID=UPI00201383BE|nr:alkaline phosphatase [Pseudemcibacter aquimaris]MCC3860104.1 alkaline phosphatase [Pseudemcibacter aquimaris]WDU57433.1 alkaline phosphatase [Pseudemcibacter aquimaris]
MKRSLLMAAGILTASFSTSIAAPKNIILLIGDGMGEAEIALTRAYEFDGEAGLFVDTMKNRGSVIVKQKMVHDPSKIEFAGESASGGTTISTGNRTSSGRVAVRAEDGAPYETILEQAKAKGFKTGLVTTSIITDATPASFAAHAQNRYCFMVGSSACNEFGDTPIVEQMLDTNVDVMLGGGTNLLPASEASGGTVEEKAKSHGYTVITKRDELMNLETGTKTFGVFSNGHMPVEWVGPGGKGADFVEVDEDRVVIFPEPAACEINPAHAGMPRLEEMSKYAMESLKNDDKGFFLMIEGASIDKQAHVAKPCGTIGEMLAFDRTVEMAVEFAKENGDTAVIVTADHGQATQVIYRPESYDGSPFRRDHIPGLYQLLLSKGGNEIGAYYGTNNINDQSHTGVNVPVYTFGMDNAEDLMGVIQQTEIYPAMKKFLFD